MAQASLFVLLLSVMAPVHPVRADQEHQGLQSGWAVDDLGNVNFTNSYTLQHRYIHEAEASWVRLNFRLGACFQDWINPGCNGRTALETYDEVVDTAQSHGFQVLGLIGHEAWPGGQEEWTANNAEHARGDGDNAYMRHFSDDAAAVLATHFRSRIRHWELWNEPNTWTEQVEGGRVKGGSFMYPSNFVWALTRGYEAIKLARPDAVIISGGLFGHDLGDPAVLFARQPCPTGAASGADYLCATYEMGLTHAGWQPGRYPFDHIGQHIYIDGGRATSEEKLRFYLDDVRDAYLLYEGAESRKVTHITEFGWSTKDLSPDLQAENIVTAFDTFRAVGYVARAHYFHVQDVPEAGLFFGLRDASGKKKPSFDVFQDVAAYEAPAGDEPTMPARLPTVTTRRAAPSAMAVETQADEARAANSAMRVRSEPIAPALRASGEILLSHEIHGGEP